MKFNTSDKSFVRVATHRQEVMMVVASYPGPINRYDLQKKDGTLLCNIGEYELTLATDDEVREALDNPKGWRKEMTPADAIAQLEASFRQLREQGMTEKRHNHMLGLLEVLRPTNKNFANFIAAARGGYILCYPGVPDYWRVKPEDVHQTDALLDIWAALVAIQRSMDVAPPWALKIMRALEVEEATNLATKQTLAELVTVTAANTNATAAATEALTHYAASNADLTAKLEEAIRSAESLDDQAVQDAIAAIKKNNEDLLAAAPQVGTAVTAGTPAA